MAAEPAYQIRGRTYAMPQTFKIVDPALVEEVTGLTWQEFVDRLPDEDDADLELNGLDPLAQLGMVAVAVWRENPTWRRDRVHRFVQSLDISEIEMVGPEDGDEIPPAVTDGKPSETSASASGSGSASTSPESTPPPSGSPQSDT